MDVDGIYRMHAPPLYRYLVQLTGDSDVASDLLHETFLRLVEAQPDERALRAWLYRVATNAASDHWRTTSRRLALLERDATALSHSPFSADPETALLRDERQSILRAALATLTPRDRSALLMREEGFTHAEIAVAIGTTTKSIGTVIVRALARLRETLGDDGDPR